MSGTNQQSKNSSENSEKKPKQIVEQSTSTSMSESRTHFEKGALLKAVTDNDEKTVREIVADSDYSINEVNEKGKNALLIATHNNYVEIAKILIDSGADVNQQDNISDSPYLYAGAQGKTDILAYILKNTTPDISKVNRFGGNALIPAAEKGHLEAVKLLVNEGKEPINFQNNFGYTALIEAVALTNGSQTYQEIIQVLLDNGADKTIRDNRGLTAENYANQLGYIEMSKILASY